jgi:hypothetical protein
VHRSHSASRQPRPGSLRRLIDDPLFLTRPCQPSRTGGRPKAVVPTTRATEIATAIAEILAPVCSAEQTLYGSVQGLNRARPLGRPQSRRRQQRLPGVPPNGFGATWSAPSKSPAFPMARAGRRFVRHRCSDSQRSGRARHKGKARGAQAGGRAPQGWGTQIKVAKNALRTASNCLNSKLV